MFKQAAAVGTMVLTISLSALTAPAYANGNGNGNSANAPGQVNKDQGAAPASANTTVSGSATISGGNGSHASSKATAHAKTSVTASSSPTARGSAGQNTATSAGLKPTNATFKNQFAPASSNRTKRYGNGRTAGQIATKAGFGSAMLFGPGNSQPHKFSCGRHFVDVHALKAHPAACTQTAGHVSHTTTPTNASTPVTTAVTTTVTTTVTSSLGAAVTNHGAAVSQIAKSGALGASATASGPSASSSVLGANAKAGNRAGSGGVLGALTTVGHGTLPFTGFPLWAAAVAGLVLIALGTRLHRRARATI
ncbi:MAG TPA: hypothetical protein VE736_11980 [Gaiellaceae bacterium]|nr:hypothetical protein [Gaiellaceae bacterium]